MKCSDCKWYKAFGAESSDQCLHPNAESSFGGIRSEIVRVQRTCEVMLVHRCEDHKLFEAVV